MRYTILLLLLLASMQSFSQKAYQSHQPLFYRIDSTDIVRISTFEFVEKSDPDFINSFLQYRPAEMNDEPFMPFDTLDYSSYATIIKPYSIPEYSDYLILWITNHEFDSDIRIYFIKENRIYKAGTLPILSACKNCDEFSYPPDKIQVSGTDETIQLSFSEPVRLKQEMKDENIYLPGKMEFILDKSTRKLKMYAH